MAHPQSVAVERAALKVLECIYSMGGGGAERQLSYLPALLSDGGWSVVAALVRGGPHLTRFVAGGAQIEWLHAFGNHDPRLVWQIWRLIGRQHPHLVHSWLPQMDVIAGVAALTRRVPWLMSERSSGDAYRNTWKDRARVALAQRATAIVANSAGGARFWRAAAPHVPVHVIANALEIEAIDAASPVPSERSHVPDGARLVLAVGRCSPEKNQRLLIEALPLLDSDVMLAICGEGALLDHTRALARKLGVADRVFFPGFVEAVWSWMKRADAFVSIGWYEGHPNAVLEAMAARCPVIVSDVEGHRDALRRDEAWFVDPASAESLAAALGMILKGDRVAERVARARARAEAFSVAAAGAAYDALYRDIARE